MKLKIIQPSLILILLLTVYIKADDVIINEIYYDPDIRTELIEYIELYNPGSADVNLSGWYFSNGISYQFPVGSLLPAGSYIIVVQNPDHVKTKWNNGRDVIDDDLIYGPFEGRLANDGEEVELCNATGEQIDRVDYQLGFPWPTVGDIPDNRSTTSHSIQLINPAIDNDLGGSWRSVSPTPAKYNSAAYIDNPPPHIRQVKHSPKQPASGEPVIITAKVTDDDGVSQVVLKYQVVEPGGYIPVTLPNYPSRNPATVSNPEYESGWVSLSMHDDGAAGDELANDDIYTVQMPEILQVHRHLIRYRIDIEDNAGNGLTVPYSDDPQPNFAYFIYDGVPPWSGAINPNGSWPKNRVVTYSAELMNSLPVYHLLSRAVDIQNCQYNASYDNTEYYFSGTLVYDGEIYDNVHYRVRGQYSTFQTGKEKWKFDFNRGHYFQARDDYGNKYENKWDKMNVGTGTCPWWQYPHPGGWDMGTRGMVINEALAFRLYNMAGVPSCNTNFFHLRVIDNTIEADTSNQYEGDFWGLYLTIEHPDGNYLDEHGLPDGNVYRMDGGVNKAHQGLTQDTGTSDVYSFVNSIDSRPSMDWWAQNVNLSNYYSSKAVGIAINDSDRRASSNCIYYNNSETGQWWMLPWDLDLTFEWATHYTDWEHFRYALSYSGYRIASMNRARELLDLLLNSDQAGQVIDEIASTISTPYNGGTFVEANRALWDYHPRTVRQGQFYEYNEFLKTQDWPGLIEYYKTFLSSKGFSGVGYGSYGVYALIEETEDSSIPDTPTIVYTGPEGNPSDSLTFETSSFSDPQGSGTFAAMKWRIAEVASGSEYISPEIPAGGSVVLIEEESPDWKYFKGDSGEPSSPLYSAWREIDFDDSSWLRGQTSIGYGDDDDNTILSDMENNYSSIYLRRKFSIQEIDEIDTLKLNIYVDDGCIIWINGIEVARLHVSDGFKAYNDFTDETYVDNAVWEEMVLSSPYNYLMEGDNIIAVHVLNSSLSSSDVSIDVSLIAEVEQEQESLNDLSVEAESSENIEGKYEIDALWESDEIQSPNSRTVSIPVGIAQPGHTYRVRCRMKDGTGRWSHWSEPIQFEAGEPLSAGVLDGLRITELMYNPASTDINSGELAVDNQNFEFIELKNISSETVNLNRANFTNGITFTFENYELAAGQYIVIVRDREAFETRYGLPDNIAGQYSGNLSNGGERIRLEDAFGQTIHDFSYEDSWYDVTDGQGFSLTIVNAANPDPNSWNQKESWRASLYTGGSPCCDDL